MRVNKKKRCLLFCEHKRWYSSVGILNVHSKAADVEECCGQNMKALTTATFSSDTTQRKLNAFRQCQNVRIIFLFLHIKPNSLQQYHYLSVALILQTQRDENPFY